MADGIIDVENLEMENTMTIFESLSGIFPDADPGFLEQTSHDYSFNSISLNMYIEGLLRSNDYPKKKNDSTEQLPDPAVDCSHRQSIHQFVTKFKDPAKYFSDRNVGEAFVDWSRVYLRVKFKFFGARIINEVLKKNKSNLTLSKHNLDTMKPDRVTKRGKHEIVPYDTATNEEFLDEVYFLENEEEIARLISDEQDFATFRLAEAKLNNDLLECQCCFNDEVFGTDVVTCYEGHIFCKSCVKRSAEIAFGDGKTKFNCLSDCESEFPIESLEGLLSEPLLKKIQCKIQEEEIRSADITGISFCPYCEYAEIPPENEKLFKCKICKKESCLLCQAENHIPLSCKEYEDEKKKSIRTQIEDKMTEALVRECYKCKKKFIKQDGCNKMVCICGAMMCYICRMPVTNYSHFKDQRGPAPPYAEPCSSTQRNKCPLWSTNRELHVDAVIQAAKAATAEMEIQNPGVHLESKQLLKGLKRKSHF